MIAFFYIITVEPHISVGIVQNLRTGGRLFDTLAEPILVFFLRTEGSHCDRIDSSLTAVHCIDNGYVGKQPICLERILRENTGKKNPSKAWICGKAFSGLERILCGILVKRTPVKHGYVGKQPVVWEEYSAKFCLILSQTSPGFYVPAIQMF